MPVSGIVIQIEPGEKTDILATLGGMPGVELEPVPDGNILVAVLDTDNFEQENTLVKAISALSGVTHVTLSYHNFEDVTESGLTH